MAVVVLVVLTGLCVKKKPKADAGGDASIYDKQIGDSDL